MKRLSLILLTLFLLTAKTDSFQLRNHLSSKYNPYDHIIIASVLTASIDMVLYDLGEAFKIPLFQNRIFTLSLSGIIVFSLGLIKETCFDDYFQMTDINANITGIGGTFIVINIYEIFWRKK